MAVTTANKVADFLIYFAHSNGDYLTNLKLQKILYYSQGWYWAIYNEQLFDERMQAWVHGPVVYSVYNRFRDYRWEPISEEINEPDLPDNVKEHLVEVFDVFGKYSAFDLRRMTHAEPPWINARHGLAIDEPSHNYISDNDIKEYFTTLANE